MLNAGLQVLLVVVAFVAVGIHKVDAQEGSVSPAAAEISGAQTQPTEPSGIGPSAVEAAEVPGKSAVFNRFFLTLNHKSVVSEKEQYAQEYYQDRLEKRVIFAAGNPYLDPALLVEVAKPSSKSLAQSAPEKK